MNRHRRFRRNRHLDTARPRLLGRPPGWTLEDSQRWLREVDRAWGSLSTHGRDRLLQGGWKQLGVGAVVHTSDLFERIAQPLCTAWSTLDARDGWDQSVVEIALRQRAWFTPRARPVLSALAASFFDVYRVVRHTDAELLLSRAGDGRLFEVNATLDDGAYPRDAYVVARLVIDGVACASIASAVVTGQRLREATRNGVPTSRRAWNGMLLDVVLDRVASEARRARHDIADCSFVAPGPRRTRRLHRAFDAIESGMAKRQASRFEFGTDDGAVDVVSDRHGTRIEFARARSRRRLYRVAASTFSSADREIARQAGLPLVGGLVAGTEELSLAGWDVMLDVVVGAARDLHRVTGRQVAA